MSENLKKLLELLSEAESKEQEKKAEEEKPEKKAAEEEVITLTKEDIEYLQKLGEAYVEGLLLGLMEKQAENEEPVEEEPTEEEVTPEDVVQAVVELVDEGHISPEEGEAILQELVGEEKTASANSKVEQIKGFIMSALGKAKGTAMSAYNFAWGSRGWKTRAAIGGGLGLGMGGLGYMLYRRKINSYAG